MPLTALVARTGPIPIALVVWTLLGITGCGATTGTTAAVEDAQLAVAVKTALLNDPALGTQGITVQVTAGVARLSGEVRSAADRDRAVDLARRVAGVRDVRNELTIGPPQAVAPSPRNPDLVALPDAAAPPRRLALGVASAFVTPTNDDLGRDLIVGPFVKLRPQRGLRPTIGFSWFKSELQAGPSGRPGLARVRIRPVMAGIEYGLAVDPVAVAISVVGGYAFNSLDIDRRAAGPDRAIGVANSLAWRPGAWAFWPVTPRVGLNVFVGLVVTRPEVSFATTTAVETASVDVTAPVVSVGVAYWVF